MASIVPSNAIKVHGLRELQASLKAIDGESQKEIRTALNEALDDVVGKIRPKIPVETGAARSSLKAQSGQREARIKAGGARVPYVPWLEFGGRVGRKRSIQRRFISQGRYIYPTYSRNHDLVVQSVADAVFGLIEKHGLDVT